MLLGRYWVQPRDSEGDPLRVFTSKRVVRGVPLVMGAHFLECLPRAEFARQMGCYIECWRIVDPADSTENLLKEMAAILPSVSLLKLPRLMELGEEKELLSSVGNFAWVAFGDLHRIVQWERKASSWEVEAQPINAVDLWPKGAHVYTGV